MFTQDELPEGWVKLNDKEVDDAVKELRRELCKGHVLYGKEFMAIARREDRDDFLYYIKDSDVPLYSVHLTWNKESTPEWPYADAFESKEDFLSGWQRIL